ncbi:MAG TPA: glutamine-hydrolyzing GMP synthase [Candidatus Sphingobacterium stercoripullorum]|uniref:GMP synthase [glutamine-hydrolyzing] n=1 Tax=Candidatus Sphingobacterium stercoripullorum TaxID=2838759 RepID=A0A9D1WA29_9SPHI|nr:glutamine-hydrolyzing GMP synthase [Candidatus Sphingobacterium stercoripullorum]HLR50690.1 glutamine-hydrolyzing GMP synthase [Candidatus Sphingobacterium stercoripullorum]
MPQKILILDFGSQYTQLIARRVRELNVYCEIFPFNKIPAIDDSIKGIILSGSPYSINEENAPNLDLSKLPEDIPLLGVCYGAQLLAYSKNGRVESASNREYGRANLQNIVTENPLLKGVEENSQVWMSHGDTITELPEEFQLIASTEAVPVAAFQQKEKMVFGLQFHPEVTHSEQGLQVLKNFIVDICHCDQGWTPESFVESSVNTLKRDLGDDHVIMALSGGVDSTVAAILLHKAIGSRLHCVFVDHGLLRKDEYAQVLESYKNMGLNIKGVDASELFLGRLEGVSDPEQKRKIIGASFIDVFDQHAKEVEAQGIQAKWLGQGTIYPDIIESVSVNGPSVAIKSHHNVGGLPDFMKLKVVEPLKALFKDEVRKVGSALEIDPNILNRHPFPGPGLAIRILGEITREKVQILQHADQIYVNHLKSSGWYDKVWQAGALFLPVQSVGVMGDQRTYENVVALRAVQSVDGMTADWVHLPYDLLGKISNDIINQVKGINRVVYDISSKPPATIEWE